MTSMIKLLNDQMVPSTDNSSAVLKMVVIEHPIRPRGSLLFHFYFLFLFMKFTILSWNCQGCASWKFLRVFREYNREYRPNLIGLIETMASGEKADSIISKLDFQQPHRVEVIGFSSGIWIAWRDSFCVEIIKSHPQFVIVKVYRSSFKHSFLTAFVYGSPNSHKIIHIWWALHSTISMDDSPWMAIGDFNAILSSNEKRGGRTVGKMCSLFRGFMELT
ncbi:hypothetical protein V6Z11_A05G372700 [Gossypium hirsutum]